MSKLFKQNLTVALKTYFCWPITPPVSLFLLFFSLCRLSGPGVYNTLFVHAVFTEWSAAPQTTLWRGPGQDSNPERAEIEAATTRLFCKCVKRNLKFLKRMPDIKTALSKKFKKLPTFAENYFINLIFLKIYIFRVPQVKTQFSLSQKNILVLETQWI